MGIGMMMATMFLIKQFTKLHTYNASISKCTTEACMNIKDAAVVVKDHSSNTGKPIFDLSWKQKHKRTKIIC